MNDGVRISITGMLCRSPDDWNVKYVIGLGIEKPYQNLEKKFQVGRYRIWEVPDYDDRFVVPPPGVEVENVRVSGDDIFFDVSGAPEGGTWIDKAHFLQLATSSRQQAR